MNQDEFITECYDICKWTWYFKISSGFESWYVKGTCEHKSFTATTLSKFGLSDAFAGVVEDARKYHDKKKLKPI